MNMTETEMKIILYLRNVSKANNTIHHIAAKIGQGYQSTYHILKIMAIKGFIDEHKSKGRATRYLPKEEASLYAYKKFLHEQEK